MIKKIQLSYLFSDAQLLAASKCKNVQEICDQVVVPHISEINRITDLENDPKYWAYAIQYAISHNT